MAKRERTPAEQWRAIPAKYRRDLIHYLRDEADVAHEIFDDHEHAAAANRAAIAVLLEASKRPVRKAARRG